MMPLRRRLLLAGLVVAAGCAVPGNVYDLEVGACFDQPAGFGSDRPISDVEVVDCARPHDLEVFHLADHPGTGSFPGEEAIRDWAADTCRGAFEPYTGRRLEGSGLDVGWLAPTADSWEQGDREVVCVVFAEDGDPLEGSVRSPGA